MAASEAPVLVVDDDPKVVALVAAYLERSGFSVISTGDGASAERLIRQATQGLPSHDNFTALAVWLQGAPEGG